MVIGKVISCPCTTIPSNIEKKVVSEYASSEEAQIRQSLFKNRMFNHKLLSPAKSPTKQISMPA